MNASAFCERSNAGVPRRSKGNRAENDNAQSETRLLASPGTTGALLFCGSSCIAQYRAMIFKAFPQLGALLEGVMDKNREERIVKQFVKNFYQDNSTAAKETIARASKNVQRIRPGDKNKKGDDRLCQEEVKMSYLARRGSL